VLRHLYAFVLGLSLFGNPVAVLETFAEGIVALFYEPYKGAVLGPEEFVLGVGVGVKNFLGYTIGTQPSCPRLYLPRGLGVGFDSLNKRADPLTLPYLTLPSRWTPHEAASSAQATRWAHCASS